MPTDIVPRRAYAVVLTAVKGTTHIAEFLCHSDSVDECHGTLDAIGKVIGAETFQRGSAEATWTAEDWTYTALIVKRFH